MAFMIVVVVSEYIYNSKKEKLVLALSSDLYFKLDSISINASELSSCFILYCLSTTYSTNYCSKKLYTILT